MKVQYLHNRSAAVLGSVLMFAVFGMLLYFWSDVMAQSHGNNSSLVGSTSEKKMEIYDALTLAVEELRNAGTLDKTARYRLTATQDESGWLFWFQFLPETPDWDYTVFVSDDAKVTIRR